MTSRQFKGCLKRLGLSVYASSTELGISLRTAQRYASGEGKVPMTVEKRVRLMVEKNG